MSAAPVETTWGMPIAPAAVSRSGPALRKPPTCSSASSVVVRSSTPAISPSAKRATPSPVRRCRWHGTPAPRSRRARARPARARHTASSRRTSWLRLSACRWPRGSGAGSVISPAIARAAWERTVLLMRLRPAISATALSMKMSLSPTNWRTVPDVNVLSITLGTPSGSARIAAVAIEVPAEPPRPSTPPSSHPRPRLRGPGARRRPPQASPPRPDRHAA